LAVSGGPDSTALLVLAARWRRACKSGPKLFAATVDHGLRPQSKQEARAVSRLARTLGVPHRTLRWRGKKPSAGIQEAARLARYRLLADFADVTGADHILTAHTLDDQAETVLMRMSRGSGMTGLGGMRKVTPLWPSMRPASARTHPASASVLLARPLIEIPKARLIATLKREKIAFSEDASNRDPRFARARLREIMRLLAGEGLDARRLAAFARRLRRADLALETAVDGAARSLSQWPWEKERPIVFDEDEFLDLPAELGLRLLGRAVDHVGDEGPVELRKLEQLYDALVGGSRPAGDRLRRTLAGAVVALGERCLTVERAPPRRRKVPQCLNHGERDAPSSALESAPTKRKIKKKGDSSRRRLAEGRPALRLYLGRTRLAPARHGNGLAVHRRP
jgi:tRNA(Ile)-lysidine synthase